MNVGGRKDWTKVFSYRYLGVSETSQTELEFCCSIFFHVLLKYIFPCVAQIYFCHVLLKYMSAWQKAISQRVLKAAFPLFNFNFKYRHSHSFQFVKCDLQHYAFNHPPLPVSTLQDFLLLIIHQRMALFDYVDFWVDTDDQIRLLLLLVKLGCDIKVFFFDQK